MQFSLSVLALVSTAIAAYVPSDPWSTLTPTGTVPSCAVTAYATSFGIAISTITSEVNVKAKRDLASQISDGQVQATTATFLDTTITENQTVYVTQSGSSVLAVAGNHPDVVVTQIGDGQIQAPNPTPDVTQTVYMTVTEGETMSVTTWAPVTSTSSFNYRSISSLTASTSSAAPSASSCPTGPIAHKATCKTDNDLAITLENGVLKDSKNRIGSIVSNRQFQFDGPVPQAGAIYAAGWGITEGHLTLGGDGIFWQCLSGSFYNLYDESIGEQCIPVYLNIIDLVEC